MPLLVKTKVRPSAIEGLGLYADEDISSGTIVWKHDFIIDGWISENDWLNYPESLKEHIKHFCCYDSKMCGWIRASDNANWMNHSDEPNLDVPNYYIHIANRDIKKGEELTLDYDKIGDDDVFFDSEFTPS